MADSSLPASAPPGLLKLGGVPPLGAYLRMLWERRQFATGVAIGELRAQHMDTVLGAFWHLLNPVLLTGVYYLIFEQILNVGSARGHENYIAFLTIGVFAYSFSQRSITSGAASIISNIGLIRSLQFPRALLPISGVIRETVSYGYSLVIVVLVLLATNLDPQTSEPVRLSWLMFVVPFALQLLFNVGAALVVARLVEQVRDMQNVLPYLFRLSFYLSGILFDPERFIRDESLHWLFTINPFYVFVSLPRQYILSEPQSPLLPLMWLSAVIWSTVLFVGGLLFFRGGEHQYGRR